MKNKLILLIALIIVLAIGLTACSKSPTEAPVAATDLPAVVDGKTLLETRCTVCHNLDRINAKKATADQWQTTVTRMLSNGAKLTSGEETTLVHYLAANFK